MQISTAVLSTRKPRVEMHLQPVTPAANWVEGEEIKRKAQSCCCHMDIICPLHLDRVAESDPENNYGRYLLVIANVKHLSTAGPGIELCGIYTCLQTQAPEVNSQYQKKKKSLKIKMESPHTQVHVTKWKFFDLLRN